VIKNAKSELYRCGKKCILTGTCNAAFTMCMLAIALIVVAMLSVVVIVVAMLVVAMLHVASTLLPHPPCPRPDPMTRPVRPNL
jgi:hypothetical protein